MNIVETLHEKMVGGTRLARTLRGTTWSEDRAQVVMLVIIMLLEVLRINLRGIVSTILVQGITPRRDAKIRLANSRMFAVLRAVVGITLSIYILHQTIFGNQPQGLLQGPNLPNGHSDDAVCEDVIQRPDLPKGLFLKAGCDTSKLETGMQTGRYVGAACMAGDVSRESVGEACLSPAGRLV